MSDSLQSLLGPNRPAVVDDLVGVIDAQVAAQKGLSGAAVKAAFAAVGKVRPDVVAKATDQLLPDFIAALQPFWDSKPAGTSFGAHLAADSETASEALLAVTDAQVESAKAPLAKAYGSLRGKAKNYVADALPAVGDVIDKHA